MRRGMGNRSILSSGKVETLFDRVCDGTQGGFGDDGFCHGCVAVFVGGNICFGFVGVFG